MGTRQLTALPSSGRWFYLPGTPVLNYHGLTPQNTRLNDRNDRFWVSKNSFADHLRHILASGCKVLLAEELLHKRVITAHSSLSVALTFDDGRASDYEVAYPLLLDAHVRATFFINTATVAKHGYVTWRQLEEMSRGGMSIQSHSHDHVDLARLSSTELDYQLRRSKAEIEDRLSCPVSLLAIPYSSLRLNIVAAAKSLGYLAICTSGARLARLGSTIIDRVCIYPDTTPAQFAAILKGSPVFFGKKACRAALLRIPKYLAFSLFPSAVDRWRSRRHE